MIVSRRVMAAGLVYCLLGPVLAVESDPLPVPADGVRERAVRLYNDGVAHLLARRFRQAQELFEQVLALDEPFAEAHNNLAYVLRMQGAKNYSASLGHYNRAIALKPNLAQAYAYRGMLFVQQGDLARARADLQQLLQLDPKLAAGLQAAIEAGQAGEDRGGIAGQYQ